MRRLVLVLAAATAAATMAACGDDPKEPGSDTLSDVDLEPVATVVLDEDGFDPNRLTVEAGDPFTIENGGDEPHRIVGDEPVIDTGDLLPGEDTLVLLDEPGRVTVADQGNDDATLEIEVRPAADG